MRKHCMTCSFWFKQLSRFCTIQHFNSAIVHTKFTCTINRTSGWFSDQAAKTYYGIWMFWIMSCFVPAIQCGVMADVLHRDVCKVDDRLLSRYRHIRIVVYMCKFDVHGMIAELECCTIAELECCTIAELGCCSIA